MAGWWLLARRLGGRGKRAFALAALQVAAGMAAVFVLLTLVGASHALEVRQDRADAREARPSVPGADVGFVSARDIELNSQRVHWVVVKPTKALKPPCGVAAWPSTGKSVVSPALNAALLAGDPDARAIVGRHQVTGIVGTCGLMSDREWVAYIGAADDRELSPSTGFGSRALPVAGDTALVTTVAAFLTIVAGVPVAMLFLAIARFRSQERRRQTAQLELLGMRSAHATVLQAAEASTWTVLGGLVAAGIFAVIASRPLTVPLADVRLAASDLLPAPWAIGCVVAVLPLGVGASILGELAARQRSASAHGPSRLGRQGLALMFVGVLITIGALASIPLVDNRLYLILVLLFGTLLQALGLPTALPWATRWISRLLRTRIHPGWLLVSLASMAHRPGPAARAAGSLSAAGLAFGVLLPLLHLLGSDTSTWEAQTPEKQFVWANLDAPIDRGKSAQLVSFPDGPDDVNASVPSALLGSCASFTALLETAIRCGSKPLWVARDEVSIGDLPSTLRLGGHVLDVAGAEVIQIPLPSRPWDSADRGAATLLLPSGEGTGPASGSGQYLFRVPDLVAERGLGARLLGFDEHASWSSGLESVSFASSKGRAPTGTLLVFLGFGTMLLLAALVLAIVTQARESAGQTRALSALGASARASARSLRTALLAPLILGLLWSVVVVSLNSAVMYALNPHATWSLTNLLAVNVIMGLVGVVAARAAIRGLPPQ